MVAFLAVVVVAQFVPGQSPTSEAPGAPAGESTGNSGEMAFVKRQAGDPTAIGAVDAPVVLTMWTDLRCPFCALFARDTLPVLVENYVDTGKVRIEFHDVAFFGEQSEDAAVAAQAAANQGRYIEFVTAVYAAAPERGHPDLPRDSLISFAEEAGVPDIAQFTSDLDDPKARTQAQAGTRSAKQLGVNSVPFFVARNAALSGAQPIANFQEFLDQALAEAE